MHPRGANDFDHRDHEAPSVECCVLAGANNMLINPFLPAIAARPSSAPFASLVMRRTISPAGRMMPGILDSCETIDPRSMLRMKVIDRLAAIFGRSTGEESAIL